MPEPTDQGQRKHSASVSRTPVPRPSRAPLVVAIVALVVALAGVGVGVWAILNKSEAAASDTPTPTADQTSTAKGDVCDVFKTVTTAVALQTHSAPDPNNPVSGQAVAANARLSMMGGGYYLLANLDPATPSDLAGEIKGLAENLQSVAMNALAGANFEAPEQTSLLQNAQSASERIQNLCK